MPIEAAPTAPSIRESLEAAVETVVPEETSSVPAQVEQPAQTSEAVAAQPPAQETEAEKAERLRNKDGTYAKGKPEAKVAATPAPAAKTPRPTSWKKEMEQYWESLAPEAQQYVLQREKEYQTGVSAYKTERDTLEAQAKPLQDAVAPYTALLAQHQIEPAKHVAELMRSHHTLVMGSPQDKAALVARIIMQNQVPLEQLFVRDQHGNIFLNQQLANAQQARPQQPQAQQITPEAIDARVQQVLMSRDVTQQFDAFTKAKDEQGQPKYPHFEALKPTMAALLDANIPEVNDYPSAYEAALALPQHRNLVPAAAPQAPQPEANKAATVARARSQAVSVKSSTPSTMTQTQGTKGLRDLISENVDRVGGGRV